MADWIDEEGYRANVGIILMHDDGRVFLGGRTGNRGWQFPQGGIQQNEPFVEALYRELQEEIGVLPDQVELLGETKDWLRYRLPPQYQRRQSIPACIGQKQRWALLRFRADDDVFRFDSTDEPAEFERFRWADFWDPVREVVYFKKMVYRQALHELGQKVFPAGLPPYPAWWESHGPDRPKAERRGMRRGPRPSGRSVPR